MLNKLCRYWHQGLGIKSWDGFHVPFSKLRYIPVKKQKNIIGILGYIYRHVLPPSTYNGYFVDNGCAILFKRIITRVRWQPDNGSYISLHPSSVSGLPEWEMLPLSVSLQVGYPGEEKYHALPSLSQTMLPRAQLRTTAISRGAINWARGLTNWVNT